MVTGHDFFGGCQHLGSRFGVQRGGMFIQEQKLGLLQGGHQKGQCLTLAAGKQAHLGRQPVFQAQIQGFEHLFVFLPFGGGNAHLQGTLLAAALCQGQVFFNLHGSSRPHHGILKHTADIAGALVLGQLGDVDSINFNAAFVHQPGAGNGIEQGGFSGAVAADDGHKIAVVQREAHIPQGTFFIDGAGIERFGNVPDFKHDVRLLSLQALQTTCSSNKARKGTGPR